LKLGNNQQKERWLSLGEILSELRLPVNQLTIISGCESGMLLPDEIDEYVGFPSVFLSKGATCVVSSLWQVNDLATTLLMDHFYEQWRSGKSVGKALHEAQLWLRKQFHNGPELEEWVHNSGFLDSLSDEDQRDQRWAVCTKASFFAKDPRYRNRAPFDSPVYWAAFTAAGLSFPLQPQ
jgi:CHAT domain-containing protein